VLKALNSIPRATVKKEKEKKKYVKCPGVIPN
jgi:hypothetical protein